MAILFFHVCFKFKCISLVLVIVCCAREKTSIYYYKVIFYWALQRNTVFPCLDFAVSVRYCTAAALSFWKPPQRGGGLPERGGLSPDPQLGADWSAESYNKIYDSTVIELTNIMYRGRRVALMPLFVDKDNMHKKALGSINIITLQSLSKCLPLQENEHKQ